MTTENLEQASALLSKYASTMGATYDPRVREILRLILVHLDGEDKPSPPPPSPAAEELANLLNKERAWWKENALTANVEGYDIPDLDTHLITAMASNKDLLARFAIEAGAFVTPRIHQDEWSDLPDKSKWHTVPLYRKAY